jgi:hypothetical protein
MRQQGFDIPPENYLYECRPPVEIKIAKGPIIRNKYGKITYRGGPETLGVVSGDLTQAPRENVRNRFLPMRQQHNTQAPRTSRVSDEERQRIRQEDVARNGQLVQVSNKTLNQVFDKFGLFTISDKILEMKRNGKMSKKDVRASALLKLTKEVMNAIRESRADEAKEAIDRIEAKHDGTIPRMDELGSTPEEVAENPLLPLAMMVDAGAVNEDTFLVLEDLVNNGELLLDPQTMMINNLIPIQNILAFDLQDIEDGIEDMRAGRMKDILRFIVDKGKGEFPVEMDEEPIEEEEDDIKYEEGDIIPRPAPPPPREIGFLPQPINPPPILKPVEPTSEEVKEDEAYAVVRSGNDVGKGVREYITELNNKLARTLSSLPIPLEPSLYNDLKTTQSAYNASATTLLDLSRQPDSVLEDERKQREIELYMNRLQDLIKNVEDISKIVNVRPPPQILRPPPVELMEDPKEESKGELEPIRQRETPQLDPKRYDVGTPLSEDEKRNPKIKRVGTRNEVWEGLAIRTGTNPRTSLTREDLVFDRRTQKVKSKNAVLGAMTRRKPTRRKKK